MLCKSQISRSVVVELPKMGDPRQLTATHFYNETIHSPTHTRQLHIFAHFVGGVKQEEKKYLKKEDLLVPHCAQRKALLALENIPGFPINDITWTAVAYLRFVTQKKIKSVRAHRHSSVLKKKEERKKWGQVNKLQK